MSDHSRPSNRKGDYQTSTTILYSYCTVVCDESTLLASVRIFGSVEGRGMSRAGTPLENYRV